MVRVTAGARPRAGRHTCDGHRASASRAPSSAGSSRSSCRSIRRWRAARAARAWAWRSPAVWRGLMGGDITVSSVRAADRASR
jgi:hypothetical protein